ncbi:MAG: flagellar hook protein [Halobacteriovoraceae bacterium]|nr:flagellar hook protein [Halobacteriovoraceae bacterium]|tara:strand:- start:18495 stop:19778 length:1284 start_codon:yes stop_codon:yes gene_type:complete
MGILSSFNVGVSGLRAAGSSMSVIGDNIANAGTFGFKGSRAEFQDMLSSSLKGIDGGDQIGSGTKLAHVTPKFTQGSINRTESVTDLAINGNGFFAVDAGNAGKGFTRDGSFHFNKDGELINGDGFQVLGFQANDNGEITRKQGPIKLGSTTIPATPTSKIDMSMNLDSRANVQQFDINNPEKTSNFNTSIAVYDNVGTQRLITVYFNKAADGQWNYHATVPGEDAQGGTPGQLVEMGKGKLVFDQNGKLQEEIVETNSFNFNKGAAPNQKIEFNFGESLKEGGDGYSAITQYGSDSSISRHTQDGSSAATLSSLSFNDEGILSASYDNGELRNIAQIAVAKFENNEGLFKMGKNLFKETKKSGQAAMGNPGVDGRGQVLAKSIELSNVDIADEFISLMGAQRNFQANTKTITTADKMLQEVLNLKR